MRIWKATAGAALALGLMAAGCSVAGGGETPEPAHAVVDRLGDRAEVRRYAPRVAVEAPMDAGRNRAFGLLFDYISGANDGGAKIAMTAPVATGRPEKIEMTAPVATDADAGTMRFFLPDRFDADSAPRPEDPRLRIVPLPEADLAVLGYSGLRTDYNAARARDRLEALIDGSAWRAVGPAENWYYDPPWTLPPFRRNELAIPVARR